jgi:hypothetical protein
MNYGGNRSSLKMSRSISVRRVAIYSDFPLTFTAYQTQSVSKSDPIMNMSEADWKEYQHIEKQYAEWQERLQKYHDKMCVEGKKINGKKVKVG